MGLVRLAKTKAVICVQNQSRARRGSVCTTVGCSACGTDCAARVLALHHFTQRRAAAADGSVR
eukprot:6204036-Pleurochrysis_carterae.AAC.7